MSDPIYDILVAADVAKPAKYKNWVLSEKRDPRLPRGKIQKAILAYLKHYKPEPTPLAKPSSAIDRDAAELLTDIARDRSFRGVHFGKIEAAAEALQKAGLVTYDGKRISLKPATKTEEVEELSSVRWLAGISSKYPGWNLQESATPATFLDWSLDRYHPGVNQAVEELSEALVSAKRLLSEVLDELVPAEATVDNVARLIGAVHERKISPVMYKWRKAGAQWAEPRYQSPSALALIGEIRERLGMAVSEVPALGRYLQ